MLFTIQQKKIQSPNFTILRRYEDCTINAWKIILETVRLQYLHQWLEEWARNQNSTTIDTAFPLEKFCETAGKHYHFWLSNRHFQKPKQLAANTSKWPQMTSKISELALVCNNIFIKEYLVLCFYIIFLLCMIFLQIITTISKTALQTSRTSKSRIFSVMFQFNIKAFPANILFLISSIRTNSIRCRWARKPLLIYERDTHMHTLTEIALT